LHIDLPRMPIGGLLIGFLLFATTGTFVAASLLREGGALETAATVGSPTPAATLSERGQQLAATNGCLSCHSTSGEVIIGPSWKGLFGKEETLADGSTVTVDEAYIRESIQNPPAKVVAGFNPVMPSFPALTEEDIRAAIAFIQSVQ